MRSFDSQQIRLSFNALKPLIIAFLLIWLVGALGLGWLIKSFLFLMLFLMLAPVLLFIGRAVVAIAKFNSTALSGVWL